MAAYTSRLLTYVVSRVHTGALDTHTHTSSLLRYAEVCYAYTQERWIDTLRLFEKVLPTFFEGIVDEYKAGNPENCVAPNFFSTNSPGFWYQKYVEKKKCPYHNNATPLQNGEKKEKKMHSVPKEGSIAHENLKKVYIYVYEYICMYIRMYVCILILYIYIHVACWGSCINWHTHIYTCIYQACWADLYRCMYIHTV